MDFWLVFRYKEMRSFRDSPTIGSQYLLSNTLYYSGDYTLADKKFDVLFSGKLAEGSKPPDVLNKLCTVLGLENAMVRELFKPGAGAIIGKDLDGAAAYALREKLRDCGVISTVKEIEPAPTRETPFSGMQSAGQPRSERHQRPQDLRPSWQPPAMPQQQGSGMFSIVFKIILLAAVAGGGWWAYQTWFAPPSPAFNAYASFAEAIVRGQYQKASDESQGDARAYAESWIQMTKPVTVKVYGKEIDMSPPSVNSIAGDIAWIKRKRKSEAKKSDTLVELQVEQTVCRIPPGVTSALCKWPVTFQHDVELQLIDGSWKVSGFKETRLTPQDK